MSDYILKVQNLSKHYAGVVALNNCSFQVGEGMITGVIGPNGAGKTTLFNLISGFEKPTSGTIHFEGKDVTNLPAYDIAALGLCRTFQSTKLFSNMSTIENMICAEKTGTTYKDIFMDVFRDQTILARKSFDVLNWANLHTKRNELVRDLSYGQQKILEPLRSMVANPKLILLDEPFAGVNPKMIENIKQNILNIKKSGKTIVLIEHNLNAVMSLCDKVIVLDQGKRIAHGTIEEIRSDKKVIGAYLGAV